MDGADRPADDYRAFLEAKVRLDRTSGIEVDPTELNPALKPMTRAVAQWMLRGGRRAFFGSFGLHKTVTQLEVMRVLQRQRPGTPKLIVAPLGVRQEFRRDAARFFTGDHAVDLRFVQSTRQIDDAAPIWLTNYESIREGKLDPTGFDVSLDEASILRGFGGTKTFREFMRLFEGSSSYRFVATATPSPNEYIELLAYAAFLDVMDVGQAKTRFFRRNSEQADQLTLHPHKEREFWLWVASWALFVQKPSDLGFSDEGYELPPIDVRWHEIPSDHSGAGAEKDGQGRMFRNAAIGVQDAAREKRDSLSGRIEKLQAIRAEDPGAHRIIWHDLEAERLAIEEAIPAQAYGRWIEVKDGHPRALELYERHYSSYQYADGRERKLLLGPGFKLVLLSARGDALFGWRKFIDDVQPPQTGVQCAVFRNEGASLSSDLIREAMAIAWRRWPDERFYTLVDPEEIRSTNPGYCFQQAGWKKCGETAGGLVILEALPDDPDCAVPEVEKRPVLRSVYGSQDLDEREQAIIDFSDGRFQELAAKPVIAGSGCNFQRHCWWEVFLGIGFKFNDFIQAIHRVQRFGQTHPVRVDIIYTEAERDVRRRLERRWAQHVEQMKIMTGIIREHGLANAGALGELTRSMNVERQEASGAGWRLVNNDSVDECRSIESDSVDLVVTSIPFSTQYEYSPSYRDFGHTDDDRHFWAQMDFIIPQLWRVLKPGRIAAIHVKDRIVPSGLSGMGFPTVSPFSDDCVAAFRRHGFGFISRVTVSTDVVRENNQTYRLGWTEQCKDGTRQGTGMPEYVLRFRKPPTDRSNGYADDPVVKAKKEWDPARGIWINPEGYSRGRWQLDAHGLWRSSGDRLLTPDDLLGLPADQVYKLYRKHSLTTVYDHEHHVAIAEALEEKGRLPPTFMLLPPQSTNDEVWSDITRMRTLNGEQAQRNVEMHICPLQFDIVDRLVRQHTMPGELVFDPFCGLGTVPLRALRAGRRGLGCELKPEHWRDSIFYLEREERQQSIPTLFEALAPDEGEEAA